MSPQAAAAGPEGAAHLTEQGVPGGAAGQSFCHHHNTIIVRSYSHCCQIYVYIILYSPLVLSHFPFSVILLSRLLQNVDMMVRFFPELLSLMVDVSLRGIHRQLKEEHSAHTSSKRFISLLSTHSPAMHITCTYTLQLLEKKEYRSLVQLLPAIAQGYTESDDAHLPDVFLHLLVLELISQHDSIKESTLHNIMREFWLPCCQSSESALLHFCRLLWSLHSKISQALLWECLEVMKPGEKVRGCVCESVCVCVCVYRCV